MAESPSSRRVMVVDDEQDILTVIKFSLQSCKECTFLVEAYPNPYVALEKFKQNPSLYSIVLTDIRMPNMNGFQFARNIKNIREDIPIVFMTAFVIDQNLPGFEEVFMKGNIIRKPEGLLEVCATLQQQLPLI